MSVNNDGNGHSFWYYLACCCCCCSKEKNTPNRPADARSALLGGPYASSINHDRKDEERSPPRSPTSSLPGTPDGAYAVNVAKRTVTQTSPQKAKDEHD